MKRALSSLLVAVALFVLGVPAEARVYKYTKPDGTVVYTDNLSDLPEARRAHYNRLEREAERRRKALENRYGKEELERREKEAERKRIQEAELEATERARRLAAIDRELEAMKKRSADKAASKKAWQERMKAAKEKMNELLKEFRKTQEEYNALAVRADFALFPGQRQKKETLRTKLAELERDVDAAIREVYEVIPEQARKAGVPPGWLR